jgi:hypothetical protein
MPDVPVYISCHKRWRLATEHEEGDADRMITPWTTERQRVIDDVQHVLTRAADKAFPPRVLLEEQTVYYGEITANEI